MIAGFAETSTVSFLAPYSLAAGYPLTAATLLISVTVGGTLLVFSLVQGPEWGWAAPSTLSCMAALHTANEIGRAHV